MLLELDEVVTRYGELEALHGITLDVGEGEIVALLGANGAGKSTTLKTISRLLAPARGEVRFEGRSLADRRRRRAGDRTRPRGTQDLPRSERPR
jgi:branched-chain amino acid transport system ATP-binding protein